MPNFRFLGGPIDGRVLMLHAEAMTFNARGQRLTDDSGTETKCGEHIYERDGNVFRYRPTRVKVNHDKEK